MKNLDPKKIPLILLAVGAILVIFLNVTWPQGKGDKSEVAKIEEMPKYKIGQVINGITADYILTKLELTKKSPVFLSDELPADLVYLVITVEIKNTSSSPLKITCGKLGAIFGGKLLEYECNKGLSARSGVFSEINPQVKKTVSIYYEISTNVLGPFVWSPSSVSKVRFSIGDFSGMQFMDFRGVTKGAREVVLSTVSDTTLLEKIKQAYKVAGLDYGDGPRPTPYKYALVDLDSDGRNEVFVMRGGVYCGRAGCDLELLTNDGDNLKVTGNSWLAGERVWILPTKSKGLFDITLGSTRMRFNGTVYEDY